MISVFEYLKYRQSKKKLNILYLSDKPLPKHILEFYKKDFNIFSTNFVDSKSNFVMNKKVINMINKPIPFFYKPFSLELVKCLFNKNFDVILSPGFESAHTLMAVLCKPFNRKELFIISETWYWPGTFGAKLLFPFVKFYVNKVEGVVLSVPGVKQIEFLKGLGVKNILKGFPLDLLPMYNFEAVPRKGLLKRKNKDKFIILYVGRIVPYKGLDFLIKSFAVFVKKHPEAVLKIVGPDKSGQYDGPNKNFPEYCRNLAKDLLPRNSYSFEGFQDPKKYYFEADVFVMPNVLKKRELVPVESFGWVVLEALHQKTPVVSSDAVGSSYNCVVQGENGYLFKNGDVDQFLECLDAVFNEYKNSKLIKTLEKRKGLSYF